MFLNVTYCNLICTFPFLYTSANVSVIYQCNYLCMCVSLLFVSDSVQPHGLYSPPGSSVHGILQARILEWVAIPFSMGVFQPRDRTALQADSSPSEPPGRPLALM